MEKEPESAIIDSWRKNVAPWIRAVRQEEIESRNLVTNQAVLDAIVSRTPTNVLDIGCGEGWLVRALVDKGIDAMGIDAIPEFIESANQAGKGRFKTLSYEECSISPIGNTFDMLVCNFSLFGDASVNTVFESAKSLLNSDGSLLVQTLHPESIQQDATKDGWREGSWQGFSSDFQDPAPWYFRSTASWKQLFQRTGFALLDIIEPCNPRTGRPASIIFIGKKA